MYEYFFHHCYYLSQVLWQLSPAVSSWSASLLWFLVMIYVTVFVLRDEVANLIPNPQCGGLGIVLSLPLPFELSGMVRPARRALWVTGITQAPPPRQGDNPWEETQFSHCQFPTVPKCPAVPVAAINCYVHQGYYSLN